MILHSLERKKSKTNQEIERKILNMLFVSNCVGILFFLERFCNFSISNIQVVLYVFYFNLKYHIDLHACFQ